MHENGEEEDDEEEGSPKRGKNGEKGATSCARLCNIHTERDEEMEKGGELPLPSDRSIRLSRSLLPRPTV